MNEVWANLFRETDSILVTPEAFIILKDGYRHIEPVENKNYDETLKILLTRISTETNC